MGGNGFYRNGLLTRKKQYGPVQIHKATNRNAAKNIETHLRAQGAKTKIVEQRYYLVQARMPLKNRGRQ